MRHLSADSRNGPNPRAASPGSIGDGKILLVDDDQDLLSSLRDFLEPEGYEVAVASDAEGARRMAEAFRPDIAVLDVKLGATNGIDLIPKLKAGLPDLACVVMTGFADTEIAVRALREGADDFLNKPVDPANLMRALNRCGQQQRLEREKRDAVAALKGSEERTRAIMENVADALVTIDAEGTIESINPAVVKLFGYEPGELIGGKVSRLVAGEERALHDSYIQNFLASGEGKIIGQGPREVLGVHKDGTTLDLELAVSEAWIGNERVFIGAMRDISERKRLEAHLRQAQKMEAVGQLTGGVAHDFNNLLGVILGNAELLEDRVGADDDQIRAVIRAAGRGAELTQRLLAFSRQQPLKPKILDSAQLLASMSDLLSRTLSETIDIEFRPGAGVARIEADPAQMENALLNLAINAGQAMPGGGKLTVEIANVTVDERLAAQVAEAEPGVYVAISVSDTGVGMAPEIVARAFDPFFTTKPVGEGSGLGLSMVYGFARQSGGFATIESEEGDGTTVRLYLPSAEVEAAAPGVAAPRTALEREAPAAQGETILVVEDDPAVCDLAVTLLESLGYQVLAAQDGARALAILEAAPEINLVLSDVMLPGGLCGPHPMQEAKRLRPDLRVLFMSGYTDAAARSSGLLADGATVINKPFRRYELACQLRVILAQTAA